MSEVARRLQDAVVTRSLFVTQLYEAEIGDETLLGELGALDPQSRRRRCGGAALGARAWLCGLHQLRLAERSCRAATPRSPTLAKLLTTPRRRVRQGLRVRPRAQAEARQPVGQPAARAGPSQRAHPPAQHHFRHALRRGSDGLRRDPLRGPSPADDDGRPDAPDRRSGRAQTFVTVQPRAGLLLLWESWLRHEVLAGTGTRRTTVDQLQLRLIRRPGWKTEEQSKLKALGNALRLRDHGCGRRAR